MTAFKTTTINGGTGSGKTEILACITRQTGAKIHHFDVLQAYMSEYIETGDPQRLKGLLHPQGFSATLLIDDVPLGWALTGLEAVLAGIDLNPIHVVYIVATRSA